jgi:tyrosyl-tRNA synthetase
MGTGVFGFHLELHTRWRIYGVIGWFKNYGYLDFLRDIGKHVPMRTMLGREFVQSRLGEEGSGISYAEFSYSLIQGYDFLHLYKEKNATLQLCGADQWGNCIAGVDLIRRKTGGESHVWSTPLIINRATGKKFGKTEDGAVWLDADKTSVFKFYQFWFNAADADAPGYLKIFSLKTREEIEAIVSEHQVDPGRRILQKALAEEITARVHGNEALEQSIAASQILFGNSDVTALKALSDEQIQEIFEGVAQGKLPSSELLEGMPIAHLLVKSGFLPSNGEARRALQENSISMNKSKVSTEQVVTAADCLNNRYILLQRGKKNYFLLELE